MRSRRTGSAVKSKRPLRIAAEIKRDLPDMIRHHVALPPGVLVSITDVEVSPDLSHAKAFFSLLSENEVAMSATVTGLLNDKKSVMRSELAQRLVMRQHPDLRFVYDPTPARAARIEALLKEIRDRSDSDDGEAKQ